LHTSSNHASARRRARELVPPNQHIDSILPEAFEGLVGRVPEAFEGLVGRVPEAFEGLVPEVFEGLVGRVPEVFEGSVGIKGTRGV
jgi:hypothetical protein